MMNTVQDSEKIGKRPDMREVVLDVEGISKRFPGILANDNVSLQLRRGQILALLGENGAGKSTLMNIIYGLYHADDGTIKLRGKVMRFQSPREAIRSGIGMVHQHFQLIPVMTVAENVLLGEEGSIPGKDGKPRRTTPPEDSAAAGTARLVWGVIWRALTPLMAIALGLLVGNVLQLLLYTVSLYLVQGEEFQTTAFLRLDLLTRAECIFSAWYQGSPLVTTILLWLPIVIGCLVGAALIVLMYRASRSTWRGRARTTTKVAQMDSLIDALIDLAATSTQVQHQTAAAQQVREISRQFHLEVDPEAYIEKLPVGIQQRVEIVKALYRKADILILDEPTAVLTPQESQELFKIMRQLAAQGVSIIFITHKLKEVLEVADHIVVMRGGKVVGSAAPQESTSASLAAMMVGREVLLRVDKAAALPGEIVLITHGISANDDRGAMAIHNVSLDVRAGEILGVAGVQGNGQTELVEVITGLRQPTSGTIQINGQTIMHSNPRTVTSIGTGHVPENRHRYGMVMTFPVADNLVLNQYYEQPFATYPSWRQVPMAALIYGTIFGMIVLLSALLWTSVLFPAIQTSLNLAELNPRRDAGPFIMALLLTLGYASIVFFAGNILTAFILNHVARNLITPRDGSATGLIRDDDAVRANAAKLVEEFDIRTPSIDVNGGNLSGGNQQKMVVAREFSRQPKLLIAAQPTRGIDVGSIEFIHSRIVKQRDEGAAVLLVSAELDEIVALSDRIAVMYKGEIIDVLPAEQATREQLGLLMAGVKQTVKTA